MVDDPTAEGWIDPAPQNPGGTNPPAMKEEVPDETSDETAEEVKTPYQSVEAVAHEVAQGRWGIGQSRRFALKKAGYDPNEVEKEVKKILNRR